MSTLIYPSGRAPLRQLPPGTKDIFDGPARRLIRLSQQLYALWQCWGYGPVMPPIFEYYDTIVRGYGDSHSVELYRLVDPQGHILALRPDLTVPIARIVATKLSRDPWPQRLCYVAPVFRYVEPQAGRQREFWQAGAELLGTGSADADAELIALLVASLHELLGATPFQVTIGQMGFLRALLTESGFREEQSAAIKRAIDRKNGRVLAQELAAAALQGPVAEALAALPALWGGPEILARARGVAPTAEAEASISHLEAVYTRLVAHGVADRVTLDLSEVRGMDYYTGITMEAFTPGSGYAIATGGRYDDLLARFGADRPAVGFSIQLERVMLALDQEEGPEPVLLPAALVQSCHHPECLQAVQRRRAAGEIIELDVMGRALADLEAEAARRGIPEVVACQGG